MSKKETWIDVQTDRRSYSVKGGARVLWENGEKVVSIEPHDDDAEDES